MKQIFTPRINNKLRDKKAIVFCPQSIMLSGELNSKCSDLRLGNQLKISII